MNRNLFVGATMASMLVSFASIQESFAASGQPLTVKAGYVNMAEVKATYPQSAVFERLKMEAESQLRHAVEKANDALKKAQEDKKPAADIEKLRADLQSQIAARQDSLSQLIMSQGNIANATIGSAVVAAAQEKGVDFVVDSTGVLIGGQKLLDSGIDMTDLVKKRLQAEPTAPAKTEPAPADKTEPAATTKPDTAK
jgi:Skp family chaperone for outer membrane proteins